MARLLVIITTARGTLEERLRGLESADDYLVKPYAFPELLARIHLRLRHTRQQQASQYRLADLQLDVCTRTVTRGERVIALTPREFELLAYLLDANGRVVTREMLARDVWRLRTVTSSMENVIDVHICRLRDKIDKDHPVRLLHTVRGVGFVMKEDS